MNRDELIQMAREAGLARWQKCLKLWAIESGVERFYNLAVAHEREARIKAQEQVADLQARIARADVEKQRAVIAEREECAKVCDVDPNYEDWEIQCGADGRQLCKDLADAIRRRGKD